MKAKGIAKNTSYITMALIFQKVLSFVYFWFISNQLFPEDLGKYVFALSFTTLFSVFTDLGMAPILVRESAKDKRQANNYFQNVLGLKLLFSAITLIAVIFFINISGKAFEVRQLVYLASIIMILDTFTIAAWSSIRSFRNLKYESIATVIVQIIIFSIGVYALKTSGQPKHLMIALISASIFNFLFSFTIVKQKLKFKLKPRWNKKTVSYIAKIIPVFALGGIFVKVYNTSDSVLLGYLASESAVGFYAVPAKVVTALTQILPAAFAMALYPVFSRLFISSKQKLTHVFEQAFSYLIVVSIPIVFGLVALLPNIMQKVWPNYVAVIPTFSVMIMALPFIFLAFPTGYLLLACNKQKYNTINRGIMTISAVILNLIFIPQYSYFGAGLTFVIVAILVFLLDLYQVQKIIYVNPKRIGATFLKTLFSSLIMLGVVLLIKNSLNLVASVAIGAGVYSIALLSVGGVKLSELKKLLNSARA